MAAEISTRAVSAFALAWNDLGLNALFKAQRPGGGIGDDDLVLFDTKAKPKTDFPYCVYTFGVAGSYVISRMSWTKTVGRECRASRLVLKIWHRRKDLAGQLAEAVNDAISGNKIPELATCGGILEVRFVGDHGGRDPDGGEEEWVWVLMYDVLHEANVNN